MSVVNIKNVMSRCIFSCSGVSRQNVRLSKSKITTASFLARSGLTFTQGEIIKRSLSNDSRPLDNNNTCTQAKCVPVLLFYK